MNHFINTVILLLLYKYVGLWYKRRQPKRRYSPSGQDRRSLLRSSFLSGRRFFSEVTFFKRGYTSEFHPSAFIVFHPLPSGQER